MSEVISKCQYIIDTSAAVSSLGKLDSQFDKVTESAMRFDIVLDKLGQDLIQVGACSEVLSQRIAQCGSKILNIGESAEKTDSQLSDLKDSFEDVSSTSEKLGSTFETVANKDAARLTDKIEDLGDTLDENRGKTKQAQQDTKALGNSWHSLLDTGRSVGGALAAVWAGFQSFRAVGSLIGSASDAQETAAKFDVVFQSVQDRAQAATDTLVKCYNVSSHAARTMLSDTGDLLAGLGMDGEMALDLSEKVNQLAIDLSSFTNFSGGAKGASEALTKALLGERESAKSLGLVISEELVKTQMEANAKKGLAYSSEMAAKAYATYQIALSQSGNAIGDAARSTGNFQYKLNTFMAALQDCGQKIGGALIDPCSRLLDVGSRVLNWFSSINPAIMNTVVRVGALGAIVLTAVTSYGLLSPAVKAFGASLKGQISGFIEITGRISSYIKSLISGASANRTATETANACLYSNSAATNVNTEAMVNNTARSGENSSAMAVNMAAAEVETAATCADTIATHANTAATGANTVATAASAAASAANIYTATAATAATNASTAATLVNNFTMLRSSEAIMRQGLLIHGRTLLLSRDTRNFGFNSMSIHANTKLINSNTKALVANKAARLISGPKGSGGALLRTGGSLVTRAAGGTGRSLITGAASGAAGAAGRTLATTAAGSGGALVSTAGGMASAAGKAISTATTAAVSTIAGKVLLAGAVFAGSVTATMKLLKHLPLWLEGVIGAWKCVFKDGFLAGLAGIAKSAWSAVTSPFISAGSAIKNWFVNMTDEAAQGIGDFWQRLLGNDDTNTAREYRARQMEETSRQMHALNDEIISAEEKKHDTMLTTINLVAEGGKKAAAEILEKFMPESQRKERKAEREVEESGKEMNAAAAAVMTASQRKEYDPLAKKYGELAAELDTSKKKYEENRNHIRSAFLTKDERDKKYDENEKLLERQNDIRIEMEPLKQQLDKFKNVFKPEDLAGKLNAHMVNITDKSIVNQNEDLSQRYKDIDYEMGQAVDKAETPQDKQKAIDAAANQYMDLYNERLNATQKKFANVQKGKDFETGRTAIVNSLKEGLPQEEMKKLNSTMQGLRATLGDEVVNMMFEYRNAVMSDLKNGSKEDKEKYDKRLANANKALDAKYSGIQSQIALAYEGKIDESSAENTFNNAMKSEEARADAKRLDDLAKKGNDIDKDLAAEAQKKADEKRENDQQRKKNAWNKRLAGISDTFDKGKSTYEDKIKNGIGNDPQSYIDAVTDQAWNIDQRYNDENAVLDEQIADLENRKKLSKDEKEIIQMEAEIEDLKRRKIKNEDAKNQELAQLYNDEDKALKERAERQKTLGKAMIDMQDKLALGEAQTGAQRMAVYRKQLNDSVARYQAAQSDEERLNELGNMESISSQIKGEQDKIREKLGNVWSTTGPVKALTAGSTEAASIQNKLYNNSQKRMENYTRDLVGFNRAMYAELRTMNSKQEYDLTLDIKG